MKPFIRYPGGKSKHLDKILRYFKDQEREYREPFVGGGSVYLSGYHYPNAWINDIDFELYDLWRMVKEEPNVLIDLIEQHTPILDHRRDRSRIPDAFALWQEVKGDTNNKLYPAGYRYLFLSKTCFSGVVTAGPTGGFDQKNYTLVARWAKNQTIKRIRQACECLQDCKITNLSWQELVAANGDDVALFCDPPYLEKGSMCYQHAFTLDDHKELAAAMVGCKHRWLVTVDNCPELLSVWRDCGVPEDRLIAESWLYSMESYRSKNRDGKELFIMDEETFERGQKWLKLWEQ